MRQKYRLSDRNTSGMRCGGERGRVGKRRVQREREKGIGKCEEDVLSYALFPQVAEKFFAVRDKAPEDENTVRELVVEDLSI